MKSATWIAYAVAWISTAAAVCCGIYFTKSAWCLWALLLPALLRVESKSKKEGEEQDESDRISERNSRHAGTPG